MASTTATWYRNTSTSPWIGRVGYNGGALVGRFAFTTPSTGASTISWASSSLQPQDSTTWSQTDHAYFFRWAITTGASDHIGRVSDSIGYAVGTTGWDSTPYMTSDGTKSVQLLPSTTYYLWIFPSSSSYNNWLISSVSVTFGGVYGTPTTVTCTNPSTFGQGNTITLSRNQSGALHTVKVSCLGRTETLMTKGSTYPTLTWTPSVATYAPLLTNAKSTTATVTVETFYAGNSVGTRSTTVTINFRDADVAPTVTMSLSDPTGHLATYGAYVATKSKIRVQLTPTYRYGASAGSVAITANGASYVTNPATTGEITSANNTTVTGKIVDSRGVASNTASATISILAYAAPRVVSLSVHRCQQDGTADDSGAYMRVEYEVSISPLNNRNSKAAAVKCKRRSDANYTTQSVSLSSYSQAGSVILPADTNATYDVQLAVTDDFSSTAVDLQLSTALATINFAAGGKGVAFGKVSEREKAVEIASDWELYIGNDKVVPAADLMPVSGSNYCKFPDGTLICWGQVSVRSSYQSWGAMYVTDVNPNVTFPIPFTEKPALSVTCNAKSSGVIVNAVCTATQWNQVAIMRQTAGSNLSLTLDYTAVGKWK